MYIKSYYKKQLLQPVGYISTMHKITLAHIYLERLFFVEMQRSPKPWPLKFGKSVPMARQGMTTGFHERLHLSYPVELFAAAFSTVRHKGYTFNIHATGL